MTITETGERAKPRSAPRISRPRVRIEEPPAKKQRRSPTKKPQRQFAILPYFFIKAPALLGLNVLETAIAVALVRLATASRFKHDRKISLDHAARMHGTAPDGQTKRDRMSQSYHRRMAVQKAKPAEHVIVETNRSALLKVAYVSASASNGGRVTQALEHFLDIADGPIEWYQPLRDGTLRVCVSRRWLLRTKSEETKWRRIPVPLPTRSLPAINLAMLVRLTSGKKVFGIKIATLSERIGIVSKPLFAQRQAISRARKQVNAATWTNIMQAPKEDWEEPDHFFYMEHFSNDIVRFTRSRSHPRDADGRAL